jgi:putative ABC transport system permease protein
MNNLLNIARQSAWNRRSTLVWVVVSLALATALLWTLERLRHDIRSSFSQSVSGVDLIVGARSSPVQLMLFSVFHIGSVPQSMSMDSVHKLAQHRSVSWVVPLSLGDSHRGFPVLGTTPAFFQHFAYGDKQSLVLQQGAAFADTLDGL